MLEVRLGCFHFRRTNQREQGRSTFRRRTSRTSKVDAERSPGHSLAVAFDHVQCTVSGVGLHDQGAPGAPFFSSLRVAHMAYASAKQNLQPLDSFSELLDLMHLKCISGRFRSESRRRNLQHPSDPLAGGEGTHCLSLRSYGLQPRIWIDPFGGQKCATKTNSWLRHRLRTVQQINGGAACICWPLVVARMLL